MKIAAGLWLFRFAIEDWRSHSISLTEVLCACLTAILLRHLCIHSAVDRDVIWDLIPGAAMLLCALILHEQIGTGDGLCMLLLGLLVGGESAVLSACTGSTVLAVLYFVKEIMEKEKGNMKRKIPFISFLAIGYGITLFAECTVGGHSN